MSWQQQEEWETFEENRRTGGSVEDETERSERRGRNRKEDTTKENLIEQERIRVASNRRFEEKQRRGSRDERTRTDRR